MNEHEIREHVISPYAAEHQACFQALRSKTHLDLKRSMLQNRKALCIQQVMRSSLDSFKVIPLHVGLHAPQAILRSHFVDCQVKHSFSIVPLSLSVFASIVALAVLADLRRLFGSRSPSSPLHPFRCCPSVVPPGMLSIPTLLPPSIGVSSARSVS